MSRLHNLTPLALALGAAIAGCAEADLSADAEGAGFDNGTAGAACEEQASCEPGLSCIGGTCLRLCRTSVDCAGDVCYPFPGGRSGYCVATMPPVDSGEGLDSPASKPPGGQGGPDGNPDLAPEVPGEDGAGPPSAPEVPEGDDGNDAPPNAGPPADDSAPAPDDDPDVAPEPPADDDTTEPEPTPQPEPEVQPEPPPPPPCNYPAAGNDISLGQVMPPFSWRTARDAAGNVVGFDLESFHCDPAWSNYGVVAFVVGTGWCSACEEYDRALAQEAEAFRAAGGLLIMVQVEDQNYVPADSETAWEIVQRSFGRGPAISVGDADTSPVSGGVSQTSIVQSYPSAFVVRRSDMRVIEDQNRNQYTLDFVQIARDNPPQVDVPPVNPPVDDPPLDDRPDNGGGCQEELGEPNDAPESPSNLSMGDHVGGVCGADADFYRINEGGAWRVDLSFTHAVGDLDLYLWDAGRRNVAVDASGNPVGSDSTDDNESISGSGPGVIMITGYEGAVSPYRIQLSR